MLKHILVAAALLVPALAYGADLSVQIVPAASPTPPSSPPPSPPPSPPTGLTPPPSAQAAGFTTLALNMDFTGATQSSYNGQTFNINDINSATGWLYCYNGAGTNPTNPIWWLSPAWGNAAPCNRVFLTNDGGTQTLDIQWQPNDQNNNGINATEMDTWTVNESANTGHDFPLGGSYIEWRFRQPQSTLDACPGGGSGTDGACLLNDVWSWPSPNASGSIEWDFIETYGNGFGAGSAHGDLNAQSAPAWGFMDYTQYHTYGVRMTTDGTNMAQCGYLDGNFVGCGSEFVPSTNSQGERVFLRLQVGPTGVYPQEPTGNNDMLI